MGECGCRAGLRSEVAPAWLVLKVILMLDPEAARHKTREGARGGGLLQTRCANLHVMSEWVTVREAAEILGVHMSAVPKMVRRGDLTPRTQRPRLNGHR